MNYKDMWLELRHRLKDLQGQASDSFQLMLVRSVENIMEEIEEEAERE